MDMSQLDSIGVGAPLSRTAAGRIVRVAGAASGIVAIAAEVSGSFVMPYGTGPKSGTSAQIFLESVRDHQAALRGYSLMAGLLSLFLLWYAVSLGSYLRQGPDGGELGIIAIVAGAAMATLHWVAGSTLLMLPLAASTWSDLDLRVPFGWIGAFLTFVAYPSILFVGAAAVRIVQTGLLPRWLGWAGVVQAAGYLVTVVGSALATSGPLALATSGPLAGVAPIALGFFVVWMAWIVATSIGLTRQMLKS
jgi:hypothetical protein